MFGTDHGFTTASGLSKKRRLTCWNSTDPATDDYRGTAGNPRPYYGLAMPQIYLDVHTPWLQGMICVWATSIQMLVIIDASGEFSYAHHEHMYGQPFTHTGAMASTSFSMRILASALPEDGIIGKMMLKAIFQLLEELVSIWKTMRSRLISIVVMIS